MAINLATNYEAKVDEKFKQISLSKAFTNSSYTWLNASAIVVNGRTTVAMNDYSLTGSARYGTPAELENTVQTMLLRKDRSFTFTIDKKSKDDTNGTIFEAGKALKEQQEQVIVPEIDTYTFGIMGAAAVANGGTATAAITASNAYDKFLDGQIFLGNNLVPTEGLLAAVSYSFYKFIKLDSSFMLASEIAMEKRINGMVGEVDGVKLVKVPSSKLPTNCAFLIAHPMATVAANKLEDFTIHQNPPGISGSLVEGRVRYDAFVLNNKVNALYMHLTAVVS